MLPQVCHKAFDNIVEFRADMFVKVSGALYGSIQHRQPNIYISHQQRAFGWAMKRLPLHHAPVFCLLDGPPGALSRPSRLCFFYLIYNLLHHESLEHIHARKADLFASIKRIPEYQQL